MVVFKISLNLLLTLFLLTIITSEPIWNLSIYSSEDISHKNPNNITLNKGTYQSFTLIIENINPSAQIQHINSNLFLATNSLKMIPNMLSINTSESLEYKINLGIPCKTDVTSNFTFSFEFDDDYSNIIELNSVAVNIINITNKLSITLLNTENIYYKTYTKFLYKANFKNYDEITLAFSVSRNCKSFLKFSNMNIKSFDGDFNFYYASGQSKNNMRNYECTVTIALTDSELGQCFELEEAEMKFTIKSDELELNKNTFYHNIITSAYIENSGTKSISLFFYKDIIFLSQFCVMQEKDDNFVSDDEILNQRVSSKNNNNIFTEFNYQTDKGANIQKIDFANFLYNKNYKIKCIFEYLDNLEKISITFGEKMMVPIKINFNHTKEELNKNICNNEAHNLDTRECDRINQRLNFMRFNFDNLYYNLSEFNITDFEDFLKKDNNEKIKHIKNLIKDKKGKTISTASDYLFIIDCEEDKNCIELKYDAFLEIVKKFPNIEDSLNFKIVKQDILLFNNLLQNSDSINYTNFEAIFNYIFDGRRLNKYKSLLDNEANITNLFFLLYDRLLTMTTNFKFHNPEKFITYPKISLINNNFLNDFYLEFLELISTGIADQKVTLNEICQNIKIYQFYLEGQNKIDQIYSDENILIQGLSNSASMKVFYEISNISVITYNDFPLFPLDSDKLSKKVVNLFLYKNKYKNRNFKDDFVTYSSTFKFIFRNITDDRYCNLINNKYLSEKDDILSNFISTEFRKNDIVCVSEVIHSPMTVFLANSYNGGILYKEGICFSSVVTTILICFGFVVITFPFIAKKYVFKNEMTQPANEFQMKET